MWLAYAAHAVIGWDAATDSTAHPEVLAPLTFRAESRIPSLWPPRLHAASRPRAWLRPLPAAHAALQCFAAVDVTAWAAQ